MIPETMNMTRANSSAQPGKLLCLVSIARLKAQGMMGRFIGGNDGLILGVWIGCPRCADRVKKYGA